MRRRRKTKKKKKPQKKKKKYLPGFRPLGEDGGVEDDAVHVGEGAESVEEELRPVGGSQSDDGVALLGAVREADSGALEGLRRRRGGGAAAAVEVSLGGHHLVQAPLRVRGAHGNGGLPRGGRGAAAEDVVEELPDSEDPLRVFNGAAGGLVGDADDGGGGGAVGPHFGLHHVAAHVPEHGGDFGEKPGPVGAYELDGGRLPRRRRA